SDEFGSWKIICTSRRTCFSRFLSSLARSTTVDVSPASLSARISLRKSTSPLVGSTSRRSVRPTAVLPQPLPPTRPRVSPSRTKKETSSTACTSATLRRSTPPITGKYFFRLRTSRRTSSRIGSLHLRVVQPTTDHVPLVGIEHRGRLVADLHPVRAPLSETAALRHEARVGNDPLDRLEPLLQLSPKDRDRMEEPLRVGVAPPLEDVAGRGVLHHLPEVH